MPPFHLKSYLQERQQWIDAALTEYTASLQHQASQLVESMGYSLLAGGKRIRPILLLAAAEACSARDLATLNPSLLPVACALEMIHTYSLIHDDLPAMDNDDLRRGKPTNHKVYGDAVAILAGDALLTEAFHLMTQTPLTPLTAETLIEVMRDVAEASGCNGMAGGQLLDLHAAGHSLNAPELEHLHRCKTGRLMEVAVTSGARLAGGTEPQLHSLTQYGRAIGLAFQIADDILDVEGTTEDLGKTSGSDQAHNKSTYPALLGMSAAKRKAEEALQEALDAITDFPASATPLRELARYIIQRHS